MTFRKYYKSFAQICNGNAASVTNWTWLRNQHV